ncbi:hypothetical protein TNCV_3863111 [Trichonephila clavipes]|uniref:Uncharacterized protein n=1 Tax=Trichonephila clavipes TaxID=2585209 RepID=A0A8X6V5W3_TRICX|nr:hypothetical protein TNCV_3863111 [Trichonephila clavipes]
MRTRGEQDMNPMSPHTTNPDDVCKWLIFVADHRTGGAPLSDESIKSSRNHERRAEDPWLCDVSVRSHKAMRYGGHVFPLMGGRQELKRRL